MRILGNKKLIENKLAVILNSSQSKTPCGNDAWIKDSIMAVKSLIDSGYTIVTSLYLNTWELQVYLVSHYGGSQVIISPTTDTDLGYNIFYKTIKDFQLDQDNTAMVFVNPDSKSNKPKSNWNKRDLAAEQMANLLVPVSIRPGGKLEKLISDSEKEINSDFKIDYAKPLVTPAKYNFKNAVYPKGDWDYVTHWTRTHHGPWPGESKHDFYSRLVTSGSEYPNNAFNCLRNMIQKRVIYASSKRIRKAIRCVGFSDLAPELMLKWMRWLPKRVGWNFEPYGIAIKKSAAERAGIKSVIYGDDHLYENLSENDKPYFQSKGKKEVDWSEENEWRKIGDLDLSKIPDGDMSLLVWHKAEADELAKLTDIWAVYLNG